jgi:serine/threonine protein kinase
MRIDSQNWQELQELFHLAAESPLETRAEVLAEACPDAELRRRVMTMLEASDAPEANPAPEESEPARSIGPYHVVRPLGAGGIGAVYLVERMVGGAPHRSALKVLAPHAAGPSFVERFHREQHILASLEHPNITRLLDAGLTGSQPYLVMEYVNGLHLDEFCDSLHWNIEQRLQLFLNICDAVAYAHRNLIVHLDLKPSNILVTQDGTVKLLDFGTSKLIQPDSTLTTTVMATPAYASPEQLRNDPVTTACDIYSLGAILFELLSGARAGGRVSIAIMIERAMREQEPQRLPDAVTEPAAISRGTSVARLRQLLRGDLATITSKCLRARPQERYLSVDALAQDIRRYLAGRPVLATPQTLLYRAGKFVRRHWQAVSATAASSLLLVCSLGYAAYRQHEALHEAQRAIQMQTFMAQVFKLANTNVMGKPAATVPEFLRLWSAVLPKMIHDAGDQRAGQISLAESMFFDADYKDAETLLNQVIPQARAAGDIPAEAEAEAYGGMVAYKLGKIPEFTALSSHALQLADKRGVTPDTRVWIKTFYTYNRYELGYITADDVRIQRDAYREAHDPRVPASELAYAANVLALVLSRTTPLAEQEKLAQEAVSIYKSEPYGFCESGQVEELLAFLQNQALDKQGSLVTIRDAYESFKQCRGDDNYDTLLASAGVGYALFSLGRTQEAVASLNTTVANIDRVLGPNSIALSLPLSLLGRSYLAMGQFQTAEKIAVQLFHIMDGKVNPNSGELGMVHLIWAQALQGEGRIDEALAHARIADADYATENSARPGAIVNARHAHDLRLELEAKAGGGGK